MVLCACCNEYVYIHCGVPQLLRGLTSWFGGWGGGVCVQGFPQQGALSVACQPGCCPFLPPLCMSDKENTQRPEIWKGLKISANIFIIGFTDGQGHSPAGSAPFIYISHVGSFTDAVIQERVRMRATAGEAVNSTSVRFNLTNTRVRIKYCCWSDGFGCTEDDGLLLYGFRPANQISCHSVRHEVWDASSHHRV